MANGNPWRKTLLPAHSPRPQNLRLPVQRHPRIPPRTRHPREQKATHAITRNQHTTPSPDAQTTKETPPQPHANNPQPTGKTSGTHREKPHLNHHHETNPMRHEKQRRQAMHSRSPMGMEKTSDPQETTHQHPRLHKLQKTPPSPLQRRRFYAHRRQKLDAIRPL